MRLLAWVLWAVCYVEMLWAVAAVPGSGREQHRAEGVALAPTSLLDAASAADVAAAADSSNASSWLAARIGKQPHIIVYMADDLGFEDTGFGGSSIIQTPFLDGLAAEAVQLTSFRTSAWCAPARSAFLTGRHEWELGTYFTDEVNLMGEAVFLSELLHDLGYHTAIAGKWPRPSPKPKPNPFPQPNPNPIAHPNQASGTSRGTPVSSGRAGSIRSSPTAAPSAAALTTSTAPWAGTSATMTVRAPSGRAMVRGSRRLATRLT